MADLKEVCLLTQLVTVWPLENVKGEGRQLAASRAAPCPGHLWAAEPIGWRHVDGLGAGRRGPGGWSHAVGQGKGQGWSWPRGPSGEVAQRGGGREPPRLASRRVLGAQVRGCGSAGRLQGLVLGMRGLEPSPSQRRVSGWQPRSLRKAPGAEPSSWGFGVPVRGPAEPGSRPGCAGGPSAPSGQGDAGGCSAVWLALDGGEETSSGSWGPRIPPGWEPGSRPQPRPSALLGRGVGSALAKARGVGGALHPKQASFLGLGSQSSRPLGGGRSERGARVLKTSFRAPIGPYPLAASEVRPLWP